MKSLLVHMGVPTNRYLNASLIAAGITYPLLKIQTPAPPNSCTVFGDAFPIFFLILCSPLFSKILKFHGTFPMFSTNIIGNDSGFLNRQTRFFKQTNQPKHSFQRKGGQQTKKPKTSPTKNSKPPEPGPSEAKFVKS